MGGLAMGVWQVPHASCGAVAACSGSTVMMASFTANFAVFTVLLVLEANRPEGGFQDHDVF